jgi:hypothetical protein
MLRIMEMMTKQENFKERIHDPNILPAEIMQRFDMIFQYAIMWSLGAIVEDASQRRFTSLLRASVAEIFKVEGK